MDCDDEQDSECTEIDGYHWSWPAFAADVCDGIAEFAHAVGVQFKRMHNLQVDTEDKQVEGEEFASSVLSGLKDL